MIDIVSLGELLVDFAPAGERTYQANAGGAPANVLAAAARLGKKAACITMVGQDDFGDMLVKDLAAAGVDTSAIRRTKDACTTLPFEVSTASVAIWIRAFVFPEPLWPTISLIMGFSSKSYILKQILSGI